MPDIEAVAEPILVRPPEPSPMDFWLVFSWMPSGNWISGLNHRSREDAEYFARKATCGTHHRIVHIVEPKGDANGA